MRVNQQEERKEARRLSKGHQDAFPDLVFGAGIVTSFVGIWTHLDPVGKCTAVVQSRPPKLSALLTHRGICGSDPQFVQSPHFW